MGADIRGAGTDVIKIHGVDLMHGTTYPIIPDQIEAGTYMTMTAAAGGEAFAQDGVVFYVPKNVVVEKTIQLVNILRADVNFMVNRHRF